MHEMSCMYCWKDALEVWTMMYDTCPHALELWIMVNIIFSSIICYLVWTYGIVYLNWWGFTRLLTRMIFLGAAPNFSIYSCCAQSAVISRNVFSRFSIGNYDFAVRFITSVSIFSYHVPGRDENVLEMWMRWPIC